jgi:hypothetical protein
MMQLDVKEALPNSKEKSTLCKAKTSILQKLIDSKKYLANTWKESNLMLRLKRVTSNMFSKLMKDTRYSRTIRIKELHRKMVKRL